MTISVVSAKLSFYAEDSDDQECDRRIGAGVSPSGPAVVSGEALRVLLVDDNHDVVETLALLIRLEGHTVAVAFDGVNALAEAAKFQPQVVLLDIGMPGMDGYQVARKLRAREPKRSMVILALSGYGQPVDRARAEAAGFTGHLTKPVPPELLLAALKAPFRRMLKTLLRELCSISA